MAISFVTSARAGTSTLTYPSGIKAGDIIVLIGHRNTTTAPSLPTGYSAPKGGTGTVSANSNAMRACYKQSDGTESGGTVTMTNANTIQCLVYRGCWAVQAVAITTNAASLNTAIPALTLAVTDGTSWVLAAAGSRQTTSQGTPSGLTLRGSTITGTTSILGGFDTNAGVSSFSSTTSAAGASATGAGVSLELLATKPASNLFETFDDGTISALWGPGTNGAGSTIVEANGVLTETPAANDADGEAYLPAVGFDPKYDLRNDAYFVNLKQALNAQAGGGIFNGFYALVNDANVAYFEVRENPRVLYCVLTSGGTDTTIASPAYDAVAHQWLRIRESGGVIYWDSSPNGRYWVNITSTTPGFTFASCYAKITAVAINEPAPGAAIWDNFNVAPPIAQLVAPRQAVNRASTY